LPISISSRIQLNQREKNGKNPALGQMRTAERCIVLNRNAPVNSMEEISRDNRKGERQKSVAAMRTAYKEREAPTA
jgi:hypothetical protein